MAEATKARMTKSRPGSADLARGRLLEGMPVSERRLGLAGVSTAVLEGGEGRPILLLHEPGAFAAQRASLADAGEGDR